MMSVVGSIAPLVPPKLASVTRAAVVKFRDNLLCYRSQCQEMYNGDGAFHQPSTWSMIRIDVLQSMHGCGAFDSRDGMHQPQNFDEVTDTHIEKFLDKRCDANRRDLPQRAKAAVAASHISAGTVPEGTVVRTSERCAGALTSRARCRFLRTRAV
jgi:hypothetical protein